MEERWWPLVCLAGAMASYGLFMRHHPLHGAFAVAFQFARNNLTIVAGLALFFAGDVAWRSWQETGLGSENTVAYSLSVWGDLLGWIPYANEDLRTIFWYCVPLDAAFILGTPMAVLTCWYWMPRLWRACAGQRWLAGAVFLVYALAFWWWWLRCVEVFHLGSDPAPERATLHPMLRTAGEIVFAVILVCFIQLVLLLGAYRSHGSGTSRCQLKEALDWGLKYFPRMVAVPLLVLVALGINRLVDDHLDVTLGPFWDGVKLVVLLGTAAVPICVLLLQDLNLGESFRASFRFLLRTSWYFAWFIFLCLTHFFLLRLVESYLLASALTHEAGVIAWYLGAALLKAGLVVWFVNAFCLYFCLDVTERRSTRKTSKKRVKLATLQARLRGTRLPGP